MWGKIGKTSETQNLQFADFAYVVVNLETAECTTASKNCLIT